MRVVHTVVVSSRSSYDKATIRCLSKTQKSLSSCYRSLFLEEGSYNKAAIRYRIEDLDLGFRAQGFRI